jgi:hypothetical protein
MITYNSFELANLFKFQSEVLNCRTLDGLDLQVRARLSEALDQY